MSILLGCIADDFTGASDLAGILARSGERVSLRMGVPNAQDVDDLSAIEVIALKSRTAPKADAVAECLEALRWLKAHGAKRFYWKYCSTFDSTNKGNIGPVSEAFLKELDADQTIYCPAFPENGRSIYMGNLYVGEQLLSESPMKDHPLTPMGDSNLVRVLEPQVEGRVGLINRLTVAQGSKAILKALDELKADGIAHVIVDAVCDEDLIHIANASAQNSLITGGSALALSLPDIYRREGLISQKAKALPNPVKTEGAIILSGSCSAMTQKQVAAIKEDIPSYQLNPLELSKNGFDGVKNWLGAQDLSQKILIYATATPQNVRAVQMQLGVEQAGELVENCLAEMAQYAFDLGKRTFVVAGGETSGAVTRALGVEKLDVSKEIAPGVPWNFAKSGGQAIALTLKSGNFGSENFFNEALDLLKTL